MSQLAKHSRIIAGAVIWLAIIGVSIWFFKYRASRANETAISQLVGYSKGPNQFVEFTRDNPVVIEINDPIFMIDKRNEYQRIGQIHDITLVENSDVYLNMKGKPVTYIGDAKTCVAKFYNHSPEIHENCTVTIHETPASLEWIVAEMTKNGAWEEYERELAAAFKQHSRQILTEFRPVLEAALKDSADVVSKDLKLAFEKRRGRIETIANRYKNDLVKIKVVPLVEEEILPIVQEHAEPIVNEVGQEIWSRASVWRFGWRLAYDKMPLPKRDLASKEWERFVEQEVTPVLEEHVDEFLEVLKEIVNDVSKDEQVRKVFQEGLKEIVKDPEVQEVFEEIMMEVFVENPNLHNVIRDHLESEPAKRAISVAAELLQDSMRKISEKMFGTPSTKIPPEFARVLRNQVLRKDSRWFVVDFHSEESSKAKRAEKLPFTIGETKNENPFISIGG